MKPVLPVAALAALAVAAHPALAAKAPKPVTQTMWLHGTEQLGNVEVLNSNELLVMDTKKPTGTSDRQYPFFGAVASPNTACAGSFFFPNWAGTVRGDLVGKVTVKFWAQGSPTSQVRVQLFDNGATTQCDSDTSKNYPGVLGETTVAMPTKQSPDLVTAVIPIQGKATVHGSLNLQIIVDDLSGLAAPQVGVVTYDSSASPSSITFTCIPKPGRTTC